MNPKLWQDAWDHYANMFSDKHQSTIGKPHKKQKPSREHREAAKTKSKSIRRMIAKSRAQTKRNKKAHKPMKGKS